MRLFVAISIYLFFQTSTHFANAEEITADTSVYIIDTDSSKIEWACDLHKGYVLFENGEIKILNGKIVGGTFNICMESIVDVDIDYELMRITLENTLKSIEFFYTEKYHYSSFTIDYTKTTQGSCSIYGDFTLLGVTKCINFQYDLILESDSLWAKTEEIIIDRTDWGVTSMSKDDAKSDKSFIVPNEIRIKVILVGFRSH